MIDEPWCQMIVSPAMTRDRHSAPLPRPQFGADAVSTAVSLAWASRTKGLVFDDHHLRGHSLRAGHRAHAGKADGSVEHRSTALTALCAHGASQPKISLAATRFETWIWGTRRSKELYQ